MDLCYKTDYKIDQVYYFRQDLKGAIWWNFLSWLNKNYLTKFIFLYEKALLQINFLCPFLK